MLLDLTNLATHCCLTNQILPTTPNVALGQPLTRLRHPLSYNREQGELRPNNGTTQVLWKDIKD